MTSDERDDLSGPPSHQQGGDEASEESTAPVSEVRRPIIPERFRDWGHVYKTRIRTSTAVLVVAFLGSTILYGYTSQRYGVVQPPPPPAPASSTIATTTDEPSWSSTPPSMSETASYPTETDSEDSIDTEPGPEGPTETQTRSTVPGLPGVPLPNFGRTQQTTAVPER